MPEAAQKAPQAPSGNTPGHFVDPYKDYLFKLVINGVNNGHFIQCTGPEITIDTISYQEGGDSTEHKIPGQVRYGTVTLRGGFTDSTDLWKWVMSAVNSPVDRRAVHIIMMDADGRTPKLRFVLNNAWPCRWRGATMDASGNGIAIEQVELTYESVGTEQG